MISSDDLGKLDRFIRKLAVARWKTLAILRAQGQAGWLRSTIDELYRSTAIEETTALSTEDASELLETLRRMNGELQTISAAVPFQRKLPAFLRPFTVTFQQIIQLRNATLCGIVSLKLRLDGNRPVDLAGLHLSASDILDARDRMLALAPSWNSKDLDIYDHL